MRAVVDTNVWVSALINPDGGPARVRQAYRDGRFELIGSEAAFSELRRVLGRPRIARRYKIDPAVADEYVAVLREGAAIHEPEPVAGVARDPDDDAWIALALAGGAEALVSRDGDVLAQEVQDYLESHGVQVLTVRRFLLLLADGDN